MEPKALGFVFHVWDTDVCTLLLLNVESLNAGFVLAAGEPKMRVGRGWF